MKIRTTASRIVAGEAANAVLAARIAAQNPRGEGRWRRTEMKPTVLLTSALVLGLSLIFCEVAESQQQKCAPDGKCAACPLGSGKKGIQCCEGGKMSACTPNLDDQDPE